MDLDSYLDIPSSYADVAFKRKLGFSLDMGGTLTKAAYTTVLDDAVRIHFKYFQTTEDFDAILDFMKTTLADYVSAGQTISFCGIGCLQFKKTFEDILGITVDILLEYDCLIDGFRFLTDNYPLTQITHELSPSAHAYAHAVSGATYRCQEALNESYHTRHRPWLKVESSKSDVASSVVEYPAVLCTSGSIGSVTKVESDGTYQVLDVNPSSGRYFLGLGSLLTGVKGFDDLMRLAEKGDAGAVHKLGKHFKIGKDIDGDVYSKYPDDNTVFCYGHVVGKDRDDVDKDDLAAAILSSVAQGLASSFHSWALLTGVKQAFICGGLSAQSALARDEIGKHFACRCEGNPLGIKIEFDFLRYGAHLGAIGGLLVNLKKDM